MRRRLNAVNSIRESLPPGHPVRRGLRVARDTSGYVLRRLALGRPDIVVTFGHGGIGDSLLCTSVCHELRKRGSQRIWVLSAHPALYALNPDIAAVMPFNADLVGFLQRRGHPLVQPSYSINHWHEGRDDSPAEHIIAALCRKSGINSGTVALRPYLHLSATERATGRRAKRQIAIQSSGRSARFHMETKEWFPERFAAVARALPGDVTLIQLGGSDDPLLPGVLDLRGRTTLRETAAILHASDLYIGLVGFLMHLARAVDCPAVIVYGGRERPDQSGYIANSNLTRQPACSPCWLWHRCDYAMKCMDAISSAEVIAAATHQLARPSAPLASALADMVAMPKAIS